jgi:hypothetical protein
MKHISILILTIILIFTSIRCNIQNKITGNWYNCQKNGIYIEFYVKDNYFNFCTEYNLIPDKYTFKCKSNTLIYLDPYRDSLKFIRVRVSFPTKNTMIWKYIDMDDSWTFKRINENIREIPDSLTSMNFKEIMKISDLIVEDAKRRSKIINCPDLRTKEQKRIDSLEIENGFQF